ncbi:feruloyl esterase [Trichoderma asperellum]|nr:Tannase/feruloyl esterase [Trichoderma asperelloides]
MRALLFTLAYGLQSVAAASTPVPADSGESVQASCSLSTFTKAGLLPQGASIENVTSVPQNGAYGEGAANLGYPTNPTGLPSLCAVIAKVISSNESSYRFGLFLPSPNQWTGRFLAVGNGGFAGGINWLDMGPGPHLGFATISTDTGHNSATADITWALNNIDKKSDWGWRAIHGSVQLGKKLTEAYYGSPGTYSYYSGCSTGGRQGLKEIQTSPDSFDGALIGAAAWYTSHLNNYVVKLGMYNLPVTDPKHIPLALFSVLWAEVIRQCDGVDGVVDYIVSSPELCKFDFTPIRCKGSASSSCFTDAQIGTAKKIYSDWYSSEDGRWLANGLTYSSEDQWYLYLNGTAPQAFGVEYVQDFLLNDPNWDWTTFNDSLVTYAEQHDPGNPTADQINISPFKDRGGKIIMYHGQSDGIVPTKNSETYYNRTINYFGDLESTTDFFRLFLIPGMQHCGLSSVGAPWNIGAASQSTTMATNLWSVPGFSDKKHDALLALVDWVENGNAVDQIVATSWNSLLNPNSGVYAQRPLCPWPQKAKYNGVGYVNSAQSWSCA